MTTYFYNNRQLLILSIIVIFVAGFSAYSSLPRLEDPRISNRNPLIITTLPGANAERVESLVTKKLETALRDLSEIKHIESSSSANISFIEIELEDSVYDTERVYTKIRDRLADLQDELPPEASFPEVDDQRGAVAFTLILGITFDGPAERFNLINRTAEELADRMRNVSGTDLVRIYGQPKEEVTVELNRDRTAELGLSASDVANRIRNADSKVASGTLRSNDNDLVVEVEGAFESLQRIRDIPIISGTRGEVVRLSDIAEIKRHWRDPPEEIAHSDGQRAIFVAVRMLDNQQVASWMSSVHRSLTEFKNIVSDRILIEPVFEQQKYTEQRLGELGLNLLLGALVVVAVIFVMMGWRNAILVGLALPLVSAMVLFSLQLLGIPLHQMSIFGLIVAIGLLIDNAIVVVDDVSFKMRSGKTPSHAIDETVRHLFIPLLGSTITTVLSFLPIFLLPGNVGEFVGSIATTVILALVFSFLVSMTIIPALTGIFTSTGSAKSFLETGLQARWLTKLFNHFLSFVITRPAVGIVLAMAIPVIGFLRVGELKNQFFPGADRNQFQVQIWTPPQSSVGSTARLTKRIEESIREDQRTLRVDWLAGGSMPTVYYNLVMNQENKPNYSQAIVTTESAADALTMISPLQLKLDETFPESQVVVRQLAQGPPVIAPIEIRVYGPSIEKLKELGHEIQRILYETPGVTQTRTTFDVSRSKVLIKSNEAEAQLSGLTLNNIASQLQNSLEGITGGILLESTEQLPVRIRYGNQYRGRLNEIASTRLQNLDSNWMPLESIARLKLQPESATIPRRNGERCNTIQAFVVADGLPPEITDSFLKRLKQQNFEMPAGYRLQVGGDSEELTNSMANLFAYAPILGILIVTTLILSFRSFVLAGLIGIVAGLSAGIAFFAIWIAGYPLGFNPLIGMAGLIGLAINDSIVVLTQIRSSEEARRGDRGEIVAEVMKTGRHVISTTLTTIGGFLPLLIGGGTFWPPLAMVIAGGVGGATILATVFVPCAYCLVGPLVDDPNTNHVAELTSNPESRDLAIVGVRIPQ